MSEKKLLRVTCDLCDRCADSETAKPPEGWVKLTYENPMLDRSRHYKHLCPSCVKKVQGAVNRKLARLLAGIAYNARRGILISNGVVKSQDFYGEAEAIFDDILGGAHQALENLGYKGVAP